MPNVWIDLTDHEISKQIEEVETKVCVLSCFVAKTQIETAKCLNA